MTSLLKDYFSDHLDRQVSKYFPPFSSRDFSHLVRELDEDEPRLEAIRSRLINVTEGLIKYLAYLSLAELCTSEKWQRLASGSVAGLIQSFITRRITGGTWRDIARDIMRNADRYGVETSCLPLRYLFSDDMLVDAISSLTTWRNASVHNRNPEVGPALNDLVTVLTGLSFLKDWYLVAVTHGVQWRLQGESARRFSGFTQAPSHDCLLLVGPVDHDEAGARPTLTLSPLMVAHINETTATIYGLEFSSRNQPILEEICGQQRIAEQALLAKIQEWSTKTLSPAASAGQVFNFGSSTSIALAGREKELSVLRRHIQEARDEKRGQVIMLEGEFGVGKSRILGNLKEWLSDENIGYASIAFTHHSIDLPGRALRRLLNYQKDKPVLSDDELQSLASTLDSHPASHLSDADVSERVENITDCLFHIADAEGGLAILIDDAHHADMVSARLVAHGAERMRSEPVPLVFLLGVQSEQLNSSRHLRQTVDRLIGFSGDVFLRMIISRLSEQEINNLCSNALHAQLSEDDSRFFREMSGGNPLYLVQLLRSAYFSRTLIQRTNNNGTMQWELLPGPDRLALLNADLRSAIQKQVVRNLDTDDTSLNPSAGKSARILSVVGDRLDPRWVMPLFERLNLGTSLQANEVLRFLTNRGITTPTGVDGILSFSSGFLRDVLLNMALEDTTLDIKRIHRVAGECLLEVHDDRHSNNPDLIAMAAQHYEEAGETLLAGKLYELAATKRSSLDTTSALSELDAAERCLGGPSISTMEISLKLADALHINRSRQRAKLRQLLDVAEQSANEASYLPISSSSTTGSQEIPWVPDPPLKERLLVRLAICEKALNNYGKAEALFEACQRQASGLITGKPGLQLAAIFWESKSGSGRYKEALDLIQSFRLANPWVEDSPEHLAILLRGQAYSKANLGEFSNAWENYNQAVRLLNGRKTAKMLNTEGFIFRLEGYYPKSITAFEQAMASPDGKGEYLRVIHNNLALCLIEAGERHGLERAETLLLRRAHEDAELGLTDAESLLPTIYFALMRAEQAHSVIKDPEFGTPHNAARSFAHKALAYSERALELLEEPLTPDAFTPSVDSRRLNRPLRICAHAVRGFGLCLLDHDLHLENSKHSFRCAHLINELFGNDNRLDVYLFTALLLEGRVRVLSGDKEGARRAVINLMEIWDRMYEKSCGSEKIRNGRWARISELQQEVQ